MRSNRRRLLAGDCLVQRISEICENHFLISANADRLGDPAEQPIPDATGLLSRVSVLSDLVKHFLFLTEFELESLFFFVAPNAQLHRFAGLLFAYPSPERSRNVGAVPVHNKVSGPQPGFRREAAFVHRTHRHRATRFTVRGKSEHSPLMLDSAQFEARKRERLLIRQRLRPPDIIAEKRFKGAACNFFCFEANIQTVAVGFPLLREIRIQAAQEVIETLFVVRAVTNENIQQVSEDLPFCVVGHAFVWPVIKRIFFQPGIQTRLLGALPAVCRAQLQFADLLAEVLVKPFLVPNAASDKCVGAVGARYALREPQRPRVLLLGVVDGLERCRPDAFHVPQVKKLVRRYTRKIFIGRNPDGGRIQMFHPAAARSLSDVQNKDVMLERRAVHQLQLIIANPAQIAFDLFLAPTVAMNHRADIRWQPRYAELLEIANFDRCVQKGVVTPGVNPEPARASRRSAGYMSRAG